MTKSYDLGDLLSITNKIKAKAEAMSVDDFDALGAGDGWIALIEDESEFAAWLDSLPLNEQQPIVDMIMSQVTEVYHRKCSEDPNVKDRVKLLQSLDVAIDSLTNEQLEKLLEIAKNPDIWLNESEEVN